MTDDYDQPDTVQRVMFDTLESQLITARDMVLEAYQTVEEPCDNQDAIDQAFDELMTQLGMAFTYEFFRKE